MPAARRQRRAGATLAGTVSGACWRTMCQIESYKHQRSVNRSEKGSRADETELPRPRRDPALWALDPKPVSFSRRPSRSHSAHAASVRHPVRNQRTGAAGCPTCRREIAHGHMLQRERLAASGALLLLCIAAAAPLARAAIDWRPCPDDWYTGDYADTREYIDCAQLPVGGLGALLMARSRQPACRRSSSAVPAPSSLSCSGARRRRRPASKLLASLRPHPGPLSAWRYRCR